MATKLQTDVFSVFYRVTHKGWDCKDDWKLSKYEDFSVKLNLLPWVLSVKGLFHGLMV